MEENKLQEDDISVRAPIVLKAGDKIKASVFPTILFVLMICLFFIPHIIGLSLGHIEFESMQAVPPTTDVPERPIYQFISDIVILFVIINGVLRYHVVQAALKIKSAIRPWSWLNFISVILLFIALLSFFVHTNLTAQQFQKAAFIASFIIHSGFLLYFLIQIPLSFKINSVIETNNITGIRLILVFLQIVSWLAEIFVRQVCLEKFHEAFNCKEYMTKNATMMSSWILAVTLSMQFLLFRWEFKGVWMNSKIHFQLSKDKKISENSLYYNPPNYFSFVWVPVSLVFFMVTSVTVPLLILVLGFNINISVEFPSISPDGPDTPKADLYTLLTSATAILGYIFVVLHCIIVNDLKGYVKQSEKRIKRLNILSCNFGMMMFFGFHLSGFILVNHDAHFAGATIFLLFAVLYMMSMTILHLTIESQFTHSRTNRIRIALTCGAIVTQIIIMILKIELKNEELNSKDNYSTNATLKFISNVFEWIMLVFMTPFFISFMKEFRSAKIDLTPSLKNTILDDRITHIVGEEANENTETSVV